MIRSIGFAIKKHELWYSILDGDSQQDAFIIKTGKQIFNSNLDIPSLMLDFYNLFNEIITQYKPNMIACKVHLNSTLDQITYMHLPIGVLCYMCKLNGICITLRSGLWITAGKNKKIINCRNHFNNQNLKNEELASVLISWYQFKE
jgi:hypothetical protein